jgi:hypothetical protein
MSGNIVGVQGNFVLQDLKKLFKEHSRVSEITWHYF